MSQPIEWPTCRTCTAEMQYQGKIETDIGLELIFLCTNDPGMCDDWDADSGGNKVILVEHDKLENVYPSNQELALRQTEYGVEIIEVMSSDYEQARSNWGGKQRDVLGQLYGEPYWLQGDNTPSCDVCQRPMRFVAQLEEGPDYKTQMNFGGGGVGYLFDCVEDRTAKFLWQC